MGLITLVTGTGNANSTRLRLMQFHALPVPVTRAINPHIALSTVLLTIHIYGIILLCVVFSLNSDPLCRFTWCAVHEETV